MTDPVRAFATTLALGGALALATTCGTAGGHRPRHVLLISIDSLRADRLGSYGNPRETSPTLDRLAAEGTRFAYAYSPSSWTLPSHVTLLTGLAQHHHGVVTPRRRMLPGTPDLASILKAHGYRTRGVYAGPYLAPLFGFAEGFDDYVSCETDTDAAPLLTAMARAHDDVTNPCLQRTVEGWAREKDDRPSFWFVHMWDVHHDYIPPAEYVRRFDPDYHGKLTGRHIAAEGFPLTATPRDVAHLVARYDGELRYTDDTIGAMLEALEAAGRLDDTLVVVTSDHGEEFLEHGDKGHMKTVFPESTRIPLLLRGPGVSPGSVVDTPVALRDVAPTILDLLGVPSEGMDGVSLRGLMRGTIAEHPPVVSALYEPFGAEAPDIVTVAVRSREATLLRPPWTDGWVLYDFRHDPLEQVPMSLRDPARVELATTALRSIGLTKRAWDDAGNVAVPAPMRRRLKELGYLN